VAPAAPLGTASISGRVTFAGPISPPARITLSSEPKCAAARPDGIVRQAIRVQGGGLADAVVYVKGGLSGPFTAPAAPVVLDQQGCEYVPAVVAVQAGQPLLVRNSDDLAHNVHFRPVANPESNKGQPRKGIEQAVTFAKAELLFPVGCDIHPWMRAFVAVLPNPYFAITSSDGAFEIKGLPAGTYEIEAAHARLKTAATTVTVKDGETAQATVSFQ
jgi:plastocyanin